MTNAELSLGPILFHWPAEKKRDFYFRIADEAVLDTIYLGEVVCGKRTPYFDRYYEQVEERLSRAGKKVIYSTLAEVMIRNDRKIVRGICELKNKTVEANDASALWMLSGASHRIGPYLNVYNEKTMAHLAANGANHITLSPELPGVVIHELARKANDLELSLEVQVFGRLPLALSARCYHARGWGRVKDNCQFVCEESPDGMRLETLDGDSFLAVNGIQTLSYGCVNLLEEMEEMRQSGVSAFRLSPHSCDMVEIGELYRMVLDRRMTAHQATKRLIDIGLKTPMCNGFYHQVEGYRWLERRRESTGEV